MSNTTELATGGGPIFLINGIVESDSPTLPPLTDLYYLPEQSLDAFAGKNAGGTWTLEIQDARTGAYLNATLESWQLRFNFANSTPVPTVINTNSAFTNFIAPGGMAYYLVEVPNSASYATNILLFATGGPLNVWFNPTSLPVGAAPDYLLLGGVGSATLSKNSVPPLLSLGNNEFYYLGVQNTNSVTVNYGLEVDFDDATVPFGSAFSIAAANITSSGARLQWIASPNVKFQMEWATNISPPIIWTTNADIITSADGIFTFTDSDSTNSRTRFYRLLQVQ
jgi:hypothetical protein